MQVEFPYGHTSIRLELPERQVIAVGMPRDLPGVPDEAAELERAMESPLGTPRLEELARGRRDAVVVVDDITRPVPYPLVLRPIIERLRGAGIPLERITILVATGLHRPHTDEENARYLGEYAGKIQIINHCCDDLSQMDEVCTTHLGNRVWINRRFLNADLKVLTGDVDYHHFAGYGGGAKSVFPGLANREAVQANHSRMEEPGAGPGKIAGNPIREEIDEVGRAAGVDFILNIVQNSRKQMVGAFAGDLIQAHRAGASLVDSMYRVAVPEHADVVIASPGGYPKDINLYQAEKSLTVSNRVLKRGGKIFLISETIEGSGSELFEQWMMEAYSLADIFERYRKGFVIGAHKAYQYARDIGEGQIFLLSSVPPGKVRQYFMTPLKGPESVLPLIGPEERIIALPQATLTLAEVAR